MFLVGISILSQRRRNEISISELFIKEERMIVFINSVLFTLGVICTIGTVVSIHQFIRWIKLLIKITNRG